MTLGWVKTSAQSSISFSFTGTSGIQPKEWINQIKEGSSYNFSEEFTGGKLIFSKRVHNHFLISPFVSLSHNLFTITFNDIEIDNVINEKYVTRSTHFFGLGLSSQYFFNKKFTQFSEAKSKACVT